MAGNGFWSKFKPRKGKMLFQITLLLITIVVASGICTFFIFSSSMNNLIEESREKVLEVEAVNAYSVTSTFIGLLLPDIKETMAGMDLAAMLAAYRAEEITPVQEYINALFQDLVDKQFEGLTNIILVDVSGLGSVEPIAVASNDTRLVYNWEVPEYVLEAAERGETYMYKKDGIPELDLSQEQLLLFIPAEDPTIGMKGILVSTKPMHEQIAAIDDFYGSEKSKTTNLFILVILITLVAIVFIAFIILSYLIYKNITKPIDELSAVAEEVMEGNLDVEVPVRKGEEIESLKLAFREMVESLRKIMALSLGGRTDDG